MNRMLLRSGQPACDPSSAQQQNNPNRTKQPTDLWSGLGFSNSLPANFLKPRIDFWNDDPNVPMAVAAGFRTEASQAEQQSQASELTKIPKGLASVREEEELSDYNQSNSSNLSSSLNRTANAPFQFLQQNTKKPGKLVASFPQMNPIV